MIFLVHKCWKERWGGGDDTQHAKMAPPQQYN